MLRRFAAMLLAAVLAVGLIAPAAAFADDANVAADADASAAAILEGEASEGAADDSPATEADAAVTVSAEGEAALADGASFAAADFSRAQCGSNRDVDGAYLGYAYYMGGSSDQAVAIATDSFVLVYVPASAASLADISDGRTQALVQQYFLALDEASNNAGIVMSADVPWYFTSDPFYDLDGVRYSFGVESASGGCYVTMLGTDGSDVVSANPDLRPTHVDFFTVVEPDAVAIAAPATGFAAFGEFLGSIDWSPLWVTLRTTGVAIVIIFVLGLLAAYFSLRIPKRAQDIADAIFTIPMVLPPTVCGFLLLLALGSNSPIGQWFDEIGCRLVFSWPATVIAAVVVAFPLMYRNARGAFEGLDSNMLDAARTLGWSNPRIFRKLMLPLSWSSIAAGTVLSFARALGEFGATLFVAGNYEGITRTIPIAIYFEWMSGNRAEAMFWAVVVIIFSFIVILFINIWSRRTTKYRRRIED